jgi:hypothetical protein
MSKLTDAGLWSRNLEIRKAFYTTLPSQSFLLSLVKKIEEMNPN